MIVLFEVRIQNFMVFFGEIIWLLSGRVLVCQEQIKLHTHFLNTERFHPSS